MDEALLAMIAASPKAFLRRSYRAEEQISIKKKRLEHLWSVSISITQAIKPVVAYTGPGDKVGDSAVEMLQLTEEIKMEITMLEQIQRETAEGIRLLVPDTNLRTILEAYYLGHMRWEEIAYTMHYAYRWTMRLHKRALKMMQAEAQKLITPVQTASNESNEMSNEIF